MSEIKCKYCGGKLATVGKRVPVEKCIVCFRPVKAAA